MSPKMVREGLWETETLARHTRIFPSRSRMCKGPEEGALCSLGWVGKPREGRF